MKVTRTSLFSGKTRTREFPITVEQWSDYQNGTLIHKALGHLSDDDREFILSGATAEEWDNAFMDDDGQPDEAQEWADFDPDC